MGWWALIYLLALFLFHSIPFQQHFSLCIELVSRKTLTTFHSHMLCIFQATQNIFHFLNRNSAALFHFLVFFFFHFALFSQLLIFTHKSSHSITFSFCPNQFLSLFFSFSLSGIIIKIYRTDAENSNGIQMSLED